MSDLIRQHTSEQNDVKILNIKYDVPRELCQKFNNIHVEYHSGKEPIIKEGMS